ncbi:MAG: hypothetical protein WKF74_11790 [Pyrinomonadaceae bacterium]
MSNAATPRTTEVEGGDIFFKCPVGGYASITPGICPKCCEHLVPVASVSVDQRRPAPHTTDVFTSQAQAIRNA